MLDTDGAAVRNAKTCPQCRAPIDGLVTVPSIADDPERWFFCVDADGNGRLSRQQVVNILVRQFPIDSATLEQWLPTLWERWDPSGTGHITKDEFLNPEQGLMRFVRTTLLDSR